MGKSTIMSYQPGLEFLCWNAHAYLVLIDVPRLEIMLECKLHKELCYCSTIYPKCTEEYMEFSVMFSNVFRRIPTIYYVQYIFLE